VEPGVRLAKLDPLLAEGPRLVSRLASLYSPLIRRSRQTWGFVFHASNTRPAFAALRHTFGRQIRSVLVEALRDLDPDVVLSVHPLLNHVAWQAIRSGGRARGLMVVVTDLVNLHRGWSLPRADVTVVPTEAAREACLSRRLKADRVHLLGLPVDLGFRPPAPGERAALRRRFGLREDAFTILVSGGGEGSGKLAQQVEALAAQPAPWQVIAVCGRNRRLQRRLAELRFQAPTLVLGFVENMNELMRASDVAVGKAGPGVIAEALATGVPLVVTGYLPGQETDNAAFVTDTGIGLYAPRPEQLLEAVRGLAADGGAACGRMAERAAAIARPYASLDVARECLALAERYRAASQASR
jgi:1,2-diacylglycerol 3-beta-galactosyltransferase